MNPLPAPDVTAAVAYIRTSSAEQGKAYGPDAQRAAINAYAAREGLRIVAQVHEDISGTIPAADRPGMQEALALAYQHGAGALIAAERSRLARDEFVAFDAERFLAVAGLRPVFAQGSNGDDDAARLAGGFEHLIAAHDRRRIVARLKAGRDAKTERHGDAARAQGGGLPHGYRRDRAGLVEIDPEAAAEVRRVFELVRKGTSIRKTAETMTAETGRPWKPTTVDRMVRREIYKAKVPGVIVERRTWQATADALASRRRSPGRAV
jgi:DNA invertase Pin-like site-specific DNA recombinase